MTDIRSPQGGEGGEVPSGEKSGSQDSPADNERGTLGTSDSVRLRRIADRLLWRAFTKREEE